jgi:hypothetical protein
VVGGERLYAQKPDDVPLLLAYQIDRSGVRLGWYWRLRVMLHGAWRRWRRLE